MLSVDKRHRLQKSSHLLFHWGAGLSLFRVKITVANCWQSYPSNKNSTNSLEDCILREQEEGEESEQLNCSTTQSVSRTELDKSGENRAATPRPRHHEYLLLFGPLQGETHISCTGLSTSSLTTTQCSSTTPITFNQNIHHVHCTLCLYLCSSSVHS